MSSGPGATRIFKLLANDARACGASKDRFQALYVSTSQRSIRLHSSRAKRLEPDPETCLVGINMKGMSCRIPSFPGKAREKCEAAS